MKILIIDDESDAASRIAVNLALGDSHVLRIDSLSRAIELVRFVNFTHAFVDLRMSVDPSDPLENSAGLQICQQLRAEYPKLVIIGYSNGFREDDDHPLRQSFVNMGANTTFTRAELTSLPRKSLFERIAKSFRPSIFIGSSSEGLSHARQLQAQLREYSTQIWNQGTTFGLGASTLESLEKAVLNFDFAIFIFTPDDELLKRGSINPVARDNVILELGLFMGKLGRSRAVVVAPNRGAVALPTDLSGINIAQYESNEPNLAIAMGPVATFIDSQIYEHLFGLRR